MNLVDAARASGCDIDKWLRAKAIIAVGGAVAEAMATRRAWADVWEGYEAGSWLTATVTWGR